MLWIIWAVGVLVFLFGVLLVLPFQVEVDTNREIFEIRYKGIFGIRVVPEIGQWRWFYRIFFIEREWTFNKPKQPKRPSKPTSKKRKAPFSARQMWKLFKNILRAVDIKRMNINWDTNDFIQNAWLFPVFHFLSGHNRRLSINFVGKQDIAIFLHTRPYRLLWAFMPIFFNFKLIKS